MFLTKTLEECDAISVDKTFSAWSSPGDWKVDKIGKYQQIVF